MSCNQIQKTMVYQTISRIGRSAHPTKSELVKTERRRVTLSGKLELMLVIECLLARPPVIAVLKPTQQGKRKLMLNCITDNKVREWAGCKITVTLPMAQIPDAGSSCFAHWRHHSGLTAFA